MKAQILLYPYNSGGRQPFLLQEQSTDCSYKEPGNITINIIAFTGHTVCCNYSALPLKSENSKKQHVNEWSWL